MPENKTPVMKRPVLNTEAERISVYNLPQSSFGCFPEHIAQVVHLFVQQAELARQSDDLRLRTSIDIEIQLPAQPVLGVLAILAHHDNGRLNGGQHGKEEVEQDKRIRIPGFLVQNHVNQCV